MVFESCSFLKSIRTPLVTVVGGPKIRIAVDLWCCWCSWIKSHNHLTKCVGIESGEQKYSYSIPMVEDTHWPKRHSHNITVWNLKSLRWSKMNSNHRSWLETGGAGQNTLTVSLLHGWLSRELSKKMNARTTATWWPSSCCWNRILTSWVETGAVEQKS